MENKKDEIINEKLFSQSLIPNSSFLIKKEIPFELSDYVLEKYFREIGERQGWLPENNKVAVLAVSGGGDSVALLWLFKKFYRGQIFVVHINHGIRGQESDSDEKFVADFAKSLGLTFFSRKINVPSMALKGESLEAAARRLRIESICEVTKNFFEKFSPCNIFLGHNRDDLAETVLFNILRGTGIRGSVGMTESTEYNGLNFYRPLLGLRRKFLRDVLRVRNIQWREDSTNENTKYTRNFIRLKLLPLIERKINSSAIEHIAAFGEEMRKIRNQEDERSRELLERCKENTVPDLVLNRQILRGFTDEERALIIREAGRMLELKTLSRERCSELSNLICKQSGFIFQWSRNMTVKSERGKIIFEKKIFERSTNNNNAD